MPPIAGGAYEARRLVPPQNSGPGGTLWSLLPQNFCRHMLLDLKSCCLKGDHPSWISQDSPFSGSCRGCHGVLQGHLQRGKWTQLASSLAQGGERIPPSRGENSPRYMSQIDDCIVSSCHSATKCVFGP